MMNEFEVAKTRYNKMMYDFCLEHLTIGDKKFSEGTEKWNISDMVLECQYQLECCFEEGNSNSEGRYTRELIEDWGYSPEDAIKEHSMWLSKTMRLKNFIKKYKSHLNTIKPFEGHASSIG